MEKSNGKLYLCPTPIGNLEDITFRTLKILNEVDLICAEDTRHSLRLLNHFNISCKMLSYHEHNKFKRIDEIIGKLIDGLNIALITDAGMPAISDPGMELVQAIRKEGLEVVALPGACAFVTALSGSGQDTSAFIFEGFLPRVKKLRNQILNRNIDETRTMIFYESPHHLLRTLKDMLDVFGNRSITIAKELTKIHEKYFYTNIEDAIFEFSNTDIKGEYVIILSGENEKKIQEKNRMIFLDMDIKEHMNIYMKQGMTEKEAMKIVAKDRGVPKREIYSLIKEDK